MALNIPFKELRAELLHWLYPLYCPCCARSVANNPRGICHSCLQRLPISPYHLSNENPIMERLYGRIPIQRGMSMLRYEKSGMAQALIHALKYERRPEIGVTLGQKYGHKILQKSTAPSDLFDAIIPVPLHEKKRLKRGYNQSEEFAKGMSQGLNIPIYDQVLLRQRNAQTQTALSREQRWDNVAQDYILQQSETLEGKHLLLVDDVLTTGATLEACGRLLLNIPGLSLSVATIAIA